MKISFGNKANFTWYNGWYMLISNSISFKNTLRDEDEFKYLIFILWP